jgi:DNA polymerase-3 subunit gamma/tau
MAMAEELRFASQPRLTLETSLLKIIEADNVVPVATLLGHLNEILASLPTCPPTSLVDPSPTTSAPAKKEEPAKPVTAPAPAFNHPSPPPPSVPPAPPAREERGEHVSVDPIEQEAAADEAPPTPETAAAETTDQKMKPVKIHPHEKDVRKDWLEFIHYVKERKVWMAQDLQRADSVKQDIEGELQLTYSEAANCSLLRQRENREILSEFAVDFFQKPLKVRFIIPVVDDQAEANGSETPNRKRAQLASDPLVIMAAEIFNGEVGDIRIGSHSR